MVAALAARPPVGVLALQGGFAEHGRMLARLGVPAREVRRPADLDGVAALIIPGGESTTIGKLLTFTELDRAIRDRVATGLAVWGTCAGLIVLAREVAAAASQGEAPQPRLGLMDLGVRRNAFGSQLDSFETTLRAPAVADHPIPAVFIRAPVIERVGPAVTVLARLPDGRPVAARQGRLLATAFHPELTADPAFHRYFVEDVAGGRRRKRRSARRYPTQCKLIPSLDKRLRSAGPGAGLKSRAEHREALPGLRPTWRQAVEASPGFV